MPHKMEKLDERSALKVVIVGGSISGLMSGIALKHSGHDVTIIDKDNDTRQSHKAGIVFGPDTLEYLARHDRQISPFCSPSHKVQSLSRDARSAKTLATVDREVTTWDALYYRLRSCFDGHTSSYYPSPPIPTTADGSAKLISRHEVFDVSRSRSNQQMILKVRDLDGYKTFEIEADLVIGADGPNSFIRRQYSPKVQRQYVGYVIWRGTVPESEVSPDLLETFNDSLTICASERQYCMTYIIPGKDGSLEPGQRLLNLAWYTNQSAEDLDRIMVDRIDGHRHAATVPSGHVREDVWAAQRQQARAAEFPSLCLDLILKIQEPFVQAVTEMFSPQAIFEDGKVLLVGDALCLSRPHVGSGVSQAAFDALNVEDLTAGRITLQQWESKIVRYAHLNSAQAIWWGKWYQQHWCTAIPYGLYYWACYGAERLRSWWEGY